MGSRYAFGTTKTLTKPPTLKMAEETTSCFEAVLSKVAELIDSLNQKPTLEAPGGLKGGAELLDLAASRNNAG